MREPNNTEQVLATALAVPMNIVNGLAGLLIEKGVISREEMISILQRLADGSAKHGEHEGMARMLLEASLARYQQGPPHESSH